MKTIINNHINGYPEVRNIISDKSKKFIEKKDLFNYGLKMAHRLTGKGYHPFWKGFFYNPFTSQTPCHFFNTINLGRNPFKVHFETTLPRLGNAPKILYTLGIKKLAAANCTEIIAISQCAYNMQVEYLKNEYPQYLETIQAKMKVQLPPQPALISVYSEKELPKDKLVFTLVGTDFFRKGGREILQAFDTLIPQHPELNLNIVSSLKFGDYATHTTQDDQAWALSIIKKYPDNINHHWSLPNEQVLELLKRTHVGLLPSWADSFGYSVLEAQAAGCPVITTDIRALPEVNNNEIGWVIEVPKLKDGNADISSDRKRLRFSQSLIIHLRTTTQKIIVEPMTIKNKGIKSLHKRCYE